MIRPYQETDKAKLIDLLRLNTPKYFAPAEEEDFVQYLIKHESEHYVFEDTDGTILGCAGGNWYPESTDGRVAWFIVDPQAQGRGVGMALLQHCLEVLRSNPATTKVIVRTSQFAEGFFAKGGFTFQYREEDYWAPGYDLVLMDLEC